MFCQVTGFCLRDFVNPSLLVAFLLFLQVIKGYKKKIEFLPAGRQGYTRLIRGVNQYGILISSLQPLPGLLSRITSPL